MGDFVKKGDLIRLADGWTVYAITDLYTRRFMDKQDHEMVSHDMGHLAGSYGSAIDVLCPLTGFKRTLRLNNFSQERWEVISD
jgi:hypothetical protein